MPARLRDACYAVLFLSLALIGCGLGGGGATTPTPQAGEAAQIDALIDKFQSSYSNKKYDDLRATFHTKANVAIDYANGTHQATYRIDEWILETKSVLDGVGTVSDVLSDRQITVYRNLATAVCEYDYRGGGKHQTGQDIFTFVKFNGEWKIFSLVFYGDPAT